MNFETKKSDFKEKLHGVIVSDPYRWLENEKSDDTKEWIKTENEFSRSILSKLPIRKFISNRLEQLIRIDRIGTPYPKKGRYFIWERKKNRELWTLYVCDGLKSKRRLLIDENKLSRDKTASLGQWSVSEDSNLIAYTISKKSNDQQSIHILNVSTGEKLRDFIPEDLYPALYSSIEWHPDGNGFWYTRRWNKAPKGEEKLHHKVYYHRLGDNFRKDALVFGEKIRKEAILSLQVSIDGKYLLIENWISTGKVRRNDLYIKDLRRDSKFRPVVKGIEAIFSAWMHRDILYILTNYRAPNWKLMAVPLSKATKGMEYWRTIIPEGKFPIERARTVRDRLFIKTLENVHSVLRIYNLDGNFISEVKLPTFGTINGLSGEREGDEIFFGFSSFLTPSRIYRFDLNKNRLELWNELKLKIAPEKFIVRQVWYNSKDKTKIPMFVIHKKGIRLNGKNPTLIYGYGGFNISLLPNFQSTIIPFIELGGVYVVANIRGGGEFGEKWHRAGTRNKKQNVFNDFVAAAEWLIKKKYTDRNHISAFGWSNGGLLMGAMITQKPSLFKALVMGAPVIDMLRFHKFHGGVHWVADYGNPDNPKDFKYLLKYSPYHNIKDNTPYPATLVLAAEGDDRVSPIHAYKFVARLQEANISSSSIILRVEQKAGHSGGVSSSKVIDKYTDIYSFLAWQLEMRSRQGNSLLILK